MTIDLAHTSEQAFVEILERINGRVPVLISHAACRHILPAAHKVSDFKLRAIAEADGVLG